jgi:formamidase
VIERVLRLYPAAPAARVLAQLARYGETIQLPMYGGSFRVPEWARDQD